MITPALFCRFCLSETSCPQEDNYPNGLCIKVNGKLFPLPVRPWIPSPLASTPDLDCVEPTSVPAGLRTSSKERPGAEEARQTPQHHLACPPLLCRAQPHFGHMVSRNWKSERRKCQHSRGTHESQLWGFGLVPADPLHLVFQTYSLSVYLVRQLTSPLLLQRLKMKGIRNPDHSRALSNSTLHRMFISAVYQFTAK